MEKRSKIYLEIIRIISIFLVILNHTPGCKLPEWNNQFGIAYYWFALLVCEIDKMAVPMFLMISGALLLPKVETVGEWFHRRVLRFVYAICIVVLFQYVYYVHTSGDTYSLQGVVSVFVRGSSINDFKVLWFLKVYVIIMLLLPLLRICCRRLSPRFFGGIVVLQLVFYVVLPAVMLVMGKYSIYHQMVAKLTLASLPFSLDYCIFYFLMGYYIEKIDFSISRAKLLWGAGVALLIGCLCMDAVRRGAGGVHVPNNVFLKSFLPIPCAAAYILSKNSIVISQITPQYRKWIATLGASVFVVMLTENICRLQWRFMYDSMEPVIGYLSASVVYSAVCFLCALILGVLIKRIPLLRDIF